MENEQQPPDKPTLLQIIKSVVGAAFGVQSEETRKRDFQQSSPAAYIIAGLAFTVIFVLALVGVVGLVLS